MSRTMVWCDDALRQVVRIPQPEELYRNVIAHDRIAVANGRTRAGGEVFVAFDAFVVSPPAQQILASWRFLPPTDAAARR